MGLRTLIGELMKITDDMIRAEAVRIHARDCGCRRPDWERWNQHAGYKLRWEVSSGYESTTRWKRCEFARLAFRFEMLVAIDAERDRQDAKFGWFRTGTARSHMPSDNLHAKVSVLAEEFGEVANAVLEGDDANLEVELIQVMAVCMAWLESRTEFGS